MTVTIPRDGRLGVLIKNVEEERIEGGRISVVHFPVGVQLHPRDKRLAWFKMVAPHSWKSLGEKLAFPPEETIQEFASLTIGIYLESNNVPEIPEDPDHYVAEVSVREAIATTQVAEPATDATIQRFLAWKLYWGKKFRESIVQISGGDLLRLGTTRQEFIQVVSDFPEYWKLDSNDLHFAGSKKLSRDLEMGRFMGTALPPIFQVAHRLEESSFEAPKRHWSKAVDFWTGDERDRENAVKEAIHAAESLALIKAELSKGTLTDAVERLRTRGSIRPPVHKIMAALYAVRGDAIGVGHAGTRLPDLSEAEAAFAINTAAAVILYLLDLN